MKYFATFLLCFISLSIFTQATYSKRFHFNYPASVLTNVLATDSAYYIMGGLIDSLHPGNDGHLFVKAGLGGDIQLVRTLTSTEKEYKTWYGHMQFNEAGNIVIGGIARDSANKALFMEMNLVGDTIRTKEFLPPFRVSACQKNILVPPKILDFGHQRVSNYEKRQNRIKFICML